jgi:RHS repeat-associated protein
LDDEIKGEGNSVNYKYRMHDPRLGRFFAKDPLAPEYPHNSPYAFSENVVINAVELEGLEKAEPPYLAGSNKPNPNAGKAIPEPTPMLTGGPGLMPTKNALLM